MSRTKCRRTDRPGRCTAYVRRTNRHASGNGGTGDDRRLGGGVRRCLAQHRDHGPSMQRRGDGPHDRRRLCDARPECLSCSPASDGRSRRRRCGLEQSDTTRVPERGSAPTSGSIRAMTRRSPVLKVTTTRVGDPSCRRCKSAHPLKMNPWRMCPEPVTEAALTLDVWGTRSGRIDGAIEVSPGSSIRSDEARDLVAAEMRRLLDGSLDAPRARWWVASSARTSPTTRSTHRRAC